ncbi:MAG: shikimate kinase [Clostridia bacterium]|nr:shikimate kinase [Clostridia bacterium]
MGKIYGLIGNPLGHSFSPQIHAGLGDYTYRLFPMNEDEVAPFLEKREFEGINVTIPYKQLVMRYCDRISPEAKAIGSVNTVVKESDGSLSGYNTDYFGFQLMLRRANIEPEGKKCLVLGSGGSSKTVCCALRDMGASSVTVISRSGEDNYDNIQRHADAEIIVNTTPVGMYPKNGAQAVDLDLFSRLTGVADLIYNPEKTSLLLQAERKGIAYTDGLYMLVAQGAKASEFFLGARYDSAVIERVYNEVNRLVRNVTLVGMPGCGKSSVGKELARLLGREFVDCDAYLAERLGRTPAQIITEDGEAAFRMAETEALRELTKRSGLVLATGGGCVTVPENHALLRQNGRVFFINRDISLLATDGRPLSAGGQDRIKQLYSARLPLYRKVCDTEIETGKDSAVLETARRIAESL